MKLIIGMGSKKKAGKFSYLMTNIKLFTDVLTLQFTKEKIFAQGMGFDHVSLFEFQFMKEWFEFYEFNENDCKTISISTSILQKLFQMIQPNQHIVISYNGHPDKIDVQFKNMKKSNVEIPKNFEIQLMDVDQEQMSIPQVDYEAEFIILTKVLETMCNQLSVFDESINLICSEEIIDFSASGIEGKLAFSLFNDKVECIEQYTIDENTTLKLEFSNNHFQNFCKFSKLSDEVKLCYCEKYPMQMLYNLEDKNKDDTNESYFEFSNLEEQSYLRFCLAPKISDDDDE